MWRGLTNRITTFVDEIVPEDDSRFVDDAQQQPTYYSDDPSIAGFASYSVERAEQDEDEDVHDSQEVSSRTLPPSEVATSKTLGPDDDAREVDMISSTQGDHCVGLPALPSPACGQTDEIERKVIQLRAAIHEMKEDTTVLLSAHQADIVSFSHHIMSSLGLSLEDLKEALAEERRQKEGLRLEVKKLSAVVDSQSLASPQQETHGEQQAATEGNVRSNAAGQEDESLEERFRSEIRELLETQSQKETEWAAVRSSLEMSCAELKKLIFEKTEEVEAATAQSASLKASFEAEKKESQQRESQFKDLQKRCKTLEKEAESHNAKLGAVSADLDNQLALYEEELEGVERVVRVALTDAGCPLSEEEESQCDNACDVVQKLAKKFLELVESTDHTRVVQREREKSFQKARDMNVSLQHQISEAWQTIGELREAASIKTQEVKQCEEKIHDQERCCEHLQSIVATLQQQMESNEHATRGGEGASAVHLQQELDEVRQQLETKNRELYLSHCSEENLQHTLEAFKKEKDEAIARHTNPLQLEIEELRQRNEQSATTDESHCRELTALRAAHEEEMEEKNRELTSLHMRLAEVRRRLGNGPLAATTPSASATEQNGPSGVDKELLAQVLSNFIHAFVEKRPEASEMLKVMSGLLNWDDAMQQKVGLLPGPANPIAPPEPAGLRSRLLTGWRKRGTASSTPDRRPPVLQPPAGPASQGKRQGSLATAWVDFLISESSAGVPPAGQSDINSLSTPLKATPGNRGTSPLPRPLTSS